jgi:hypothetical protein
MSSEEVVGDAASGGGGGGGGGGGDTLPSIKPDGGNGLNDFELTALQGLFDTYDKAGVGYITKAELIDLTDHIKHDLEAARDFAEPLKLERDDAQVSFDQFAGLVAEHPDKALRNFIIHAGVVEFLQILATYQRECEAQNNFMEAQRAAQQIKVLKQQEEARQQMRLLFAQKLEKYDAAEARSEQIQIFNEKWDKCVLADRPLAGPTLMRMVRGLHAERVAAPVSVRVFTRACGICVCGELVRAILGFRFGSKFVFALLPSPTHNHKNMRDSRSHHATANARWSVGRAGVGRVVMYFNNAAPSVTSVFCC